ncbi:Ig-like domain-containing protein [Paenibacillus sp. IB182496]|uniref:Ig-like domain-containing protein n=1 Tax=Paenibacillus sabuli TaxID=2772509 RepID=A0A927BTD3_9BACL|nr:Ig-like domain-containing protein [Paenibacillus sabuli]MBD2845320.1 Ig-like domain-containing protein [Paenibacillus sabuli]
MKKKTAITLIFFLLWGSFPLAMNNLIETRAEGVNLVPNASFEAYTPVAGGSWSDASADGWAVSTFSGTPTYTVDTTTAHAGSAAVRIAAETTSRGAIARRIAIEGDADYAFGVWARTEQLLSSSVGARIRMQFYDADNANLNQHVMFGSLLGTEDWTHLQKYVHTPSDAESVLIELFIWNAAGTAWFDDVSLEQVDEYVPVTEVSAACPDKALTVGESVYVPAQALPEQATNRSLTWSSSEAGVASVDSGMVSGLTPGWTVISAHTEDGPQANCPMTITAYPGTNALPNGNMEQVTASSEGGWSDWRADGWSAYTYSGAVNFTVDHAERHGGAASVKLYAEEQSRAMIARSIPVRAGATYEVKAWFKTLDLASTNVGSRMRLMFYDAANQNLNQHVMFGSVKGTQDWTLVEQQIEVPAGAVSMRVAAFLWEAEGTVWFDDMEITELVPVAEVSLDRRTAVVEAAQQVQLEATVLPVYATDQALVWTTSDPSVATVTYGMVTGVAPGVARITATSPEGPQQSAMVAVGANGYELPDAHVAASVDANAESNGQLAVEDAQQHALSYILLDEPHSGWADVKSSGAWTYVPQANYTGADRIGVVMMNGDGGIGYTEVTLDVRGSNRPPTVHDQQRQTVKNQLRVEPLRTDDPDGDALSFAVSLSPGHGTVTVDGSGEWSYMPDLDYTGHDAFKIEVSDGNGGTAEASVSIYVAPTRTDLISQLKSESLGQHPRVMMQAQDLQRILQLVDTDVHMIQWYANVKTEADALLSAPVADEQANMLQTARNTVDRVQTLAMAYLVSEDAQYAERAWDELEAVADFDDWNPSHFLDTAEMTYAVAIGYDWLYDYWTAQRKSELRTAMVNKGLNPALSGYRNGEWWSRTSSNWNSVVSGGIAMGALAIGDESPELETLAGELLEYAVKSVPTMLADYAPDGGWPEGPMYWRYGTRYAVYMLESLQIALGTDYELSDMPGFADTLAFLMQVSGPVEVFNYADTIPDTYRSPLALWFADREQDGTYIDFYRAHEDEAASGGIYEMLWYRPALYANPDAREEVDGYFQRMEAVTMRSHPTSPQASFVGFKGGDNAINHGHLDIGSFVYDALGIRWASDFGVDNYDLPDYFGDRRFDYYRLRPEGHNTLVIDPDDTPGQPEQAQARMERVETKPQGALAIADLTEAYWGDALSVKRGMKLFDMRQQVMVQDEFSLRKPSELYWFMHTAADIELVEDGQAAVLSMADKKLYVKLIEAPEGAAFSIMPSRPLPSSPDPEGQALNHGVRKLTVHLEDVREGALSVWMVPMHEQDALPATSPTYTPLAGWSIPDGELPLQQALPELQAIQMDGIALADFDPEQTYYAVSLPFETEDVPQITATAAYDVTIEPASGVPGKTRIIVTDTVYTQLEQRYTIDFKQGPIIGNLPEVNRWPVTAVTASDVPQADQGHTPDRTLDGDLGTRWSAFGAQWIQYDLGQSRAVGAVSIAYLSGSARQYYFELQASEDGVNWTSLLTTTSSGETEQPELFPVPEVEARYIRILSNGNSANNWNSITEVAIFRPSPVHLAVTGPDTLTINETTQLQAKRLYADGSRVATTETTFASDQPGVVEVSASGDVHGLAAGEATITVTDLVYGLSTAIPITVTAP